MKFLKILITSIILIIIPSLLFGKVGNYNLIYNSPNFNIYMKKEIKENNLILKGYIENNFWSALNTIFIYVTTIDKKGHKIEEKEYYISELNPIPEPGSKKKIKFKFKNADKIAKLNFTINFNYQAYKISDINEFEDFSILLSNIPF